MVYVVLETDNAVGALHAALDVFRRHAINLTMISSRQSRVHPGKYDIICELEECNPDLDALTADLSQVVLVRKTQFGAVSEGTTPVTSDVILTTETASSQAGVHPYPRSLEDLDGFAVKTLEYGSELSADHPGFTDAAYRRRRAEITALASTYRTGMAIPHVDYTLEEIKTWQAVWDKLTALFPTHACEQHQRVLPLLTKECGYSRDAIPQLQNVSQFLRRRTGFTLRPVMGLLSSRDFLNGLAFRVFHSTQYIRHGSQPLYTPEPDVCHELLGHVPMFADDDFAAFSQELGLASLGASDDEIKRLATIYWFTVEFGLCRQSTATASTCADEAVVPLCERSDPDGGELRAYGAGLLSSFGELEYSLRAERGDGPKLLRFDIEQMATTDYPVTRFQPQYFVAPSFQDAQQQVREYARRRPGLGLNVRYDTLTGTIRDMWRDDERQRLVRLLQRDLQCLGR